MGLLGDLTSAALFETRNEAEAAWELLSEAGISAAVITDPGLLGKYTMSVEVDREDLDRAVAVLQAGPSDDQPDERST